MKELLDRFVGIERALSEENGEFALFALLLREDAADKWDLVVAAPWIEADRKAALSLVTGRIQGAFTPKELSLLSRVVLIDLANPAVGAMNQAVRVQHGPAAEILNSNFFGLQIKHAYIITSQRMNVDEQVPA
jgi:hypothetical protein